MSPEREHTAGFAGAGALVTGAAGEIGAGVARGLVERGARVSLLDRDRDALAQLADTLGEQALAVPVDVSHESQVAEAVQTAEEHGRGLSVVFNNAGIEGPVGPIESLDLQELEAVFRVNVIGAAAVLKHALPRMGPGGVALQAGSTASVAGAPHLTPYVASKHALLGLTRSASREVACRGVRVSAILPGPVSGRMMERISGGREDAETAGTSNPTALDGGRYATVEEVVAAVLFLLGPDAGFVAGTGLLLDGGRLA